MSEIDLESKFNLLLIRLRTNNEPKPFFAEDLLSCWGQQGDCEFDADNLLYLVIKVEKMGCWKNKLNPEAASHILYPWKDYIEGSRRFMQQQILKPRCSDPKHEHVRDKPYSFFRYCFCAASFVLVVNCSYC